MNDKRGYTGKHAYSLQQDDRPLAPDTVSSAPRGGGFSPLGWGDRFRIIAALLVVAIHTSPLATFGDFPNYVLTRVIARLGVPFFFAATGFFLLAPYAKDKLRSAGSIGGFVKKTALVYAVAIILYLPINIYAGHFALGNLFVTITRLLLVEGTMYHLWYLPAAIAGVVIVWALLRFTSLKVATAVSGLLYAVGLLGDSYYGISASVPALKTMFDGIFTVITYTRNGLFMAPVFLLVGVWAARGRPAKRNAALAALLVSLGLLLAEGIALYTAPNKHDSMYIVLPVCVFCLMRWLATFSGHPNKKLRAASLIIYIVHPMMIVLIRSAARVLGLVPLMVENSLLHYFLVCAGSFLAAVILLYCKGGMEYVLQAKQRQKTARLGGNRHE